MTNEEPRIITKEPTENENHEPILKTHEIQISHKIRQHKIPQKLPKITRKLMHKKHKKQSTQEVKSTIYAQTQTLTTQTHTDIKKRIKRLEDSN